MLKLPRVPNLTEMAYLTVRTHLLEGSLAEGERLTEEAVASQLGISKSPVREALNRLEAEGLIVIAARRGAYVRRFTRSETRDLYNVREVLEAYAVRTARVTPELLEELERSVERTTAHLEHADRAAHVDEDMRFHALIAASTGNSELMGLLENVQHKSLLSRVKTFRLSASATPAGHRRILDGLKAEDRSFAEQAMREHIAFVREALLANMAEEASEPQPSEANEPEGGAAELATAAGAPVAEA